MEQWKEIPEFPGYEVSDQGQVRNGSTLRILSLHANGRGFIQVTLRRDFNNHIRAVHKLVACAFMDWGPEGTVPIHINGDRRDNTVGNLDWKPLWFALARTQQRNRKAPRDPRPIRALKTGVIFENALHAANELDGLEDEVLKAAQYGPPTTYKGTTFEFVKTNTISQYKHRL